jgi:hypothetical protein
MRFLSLARFALIGLAALGAESSSAESFHLERIASGLNQPTYVTQAPGDPANILYFTERTSNTIGGFTPVNDMGKVWRYDVTTRSKSLVLDLSARDVINDTGLQTIAFSPDFNTPGAPTFQKLFVSSSERGATALNRVEEFTIGSGGTATFSRTILEYPNNGQNNHTVDWIGFDPNAAGAERGYLYISTGDGSFGNSYDSGTSPAGRPSQNPSDVAGKILRVDLAGGDAYPADAKKNFGIPASNPIPTYNAAHPGSPLTGVAKVGGNVVPAAALGEVWVTGVRNGYRASFDRATSDMWLGDVGETVWEEVDFIKAGSNATGPPVDLGWPQLEGVGHSDVSGAPHTSVNPFTGVTALNPLQQKSHASGDQAWIGGYVYRGPVAELQGRYFFSEFVTQKVYQLQFDRNTPAASFNGANGTRTDVTNLWNALVMDPTDPTYLPSTSATDMAGLDHLVSFGEDNAGNLYLVDFGNRSPSQSSFNGQYPNAGLGEIFRVTPNLPFTLTVDRDTRAMTITNDTGAPLEIRGYSIASATGSIQRSSLTPVAGNYDEPPGGNGTVDADDDWQVTSPVGSLTEFSESAIGGATATLEAGQQFSLSTGGGWIPSQTEDLLLSVTLANGASTFATVQYVGNGGQPFTRSDLDFDGGLDLDDWRVFVQKNAASLGGLSLAQQYGAGDLNGDGANDYDDFRIFQADYDGANGVGALVQALAGVPEPGALGMAVATVLLAASGCRRRPLGDAAPLVIPVSVPLASRQCAAGTRSFLSIEA